MNTLIQLMFGNSNTGVKTAVTRSPHPRSVKMIQNFHLVWLDENFDDTKNDFRNSLTKLRQVVNMVNKFTNADECIEFIDKIKDEKALVISSGALGQTTIPRINDKSQVHTIYIFCKAKAYHEQWSKDWSKVAGVHIDIQPICEALKQAVLDCDQNSISISLIRKNDGIQNIKLDRFDRSFMCTQILKEILLAINFDREHFKSFLCYCREELTGNDDQLKNVDMIEKEYKHDQAIWWYTYECFLYSMLNRALRTMEVDLITTIGFFIHDLHNHIAALHTKQYGDKNRAKTFVVYRGQGLLQVDFDVLKKTQGGLLAFNNFLSTTTNSKVSLKFAESTTKNPDNVGVLFVMKIDPSISATPFANIKTVSYYKGDEEILFSMHSVFRIGEVKQIDRKNDRLWQVELTLTGDHDQQLQKLREAMQAEIMESTGWFRLGQLMMKVARYDRAQQVFEMILSETVDEKETSEVYYHLGLINKEQGKYKEALSHFEKALKIQQNTLPENHSTFARTFNNIGEVRNRMGEHLEALSNHKKALEIQQKTLPENHSDFAQSYNNIGTVYYHIGDYLNALLYFEKAFPILEQSLPKNDPNLAVANDNIGLAYFHMVEYSKALSHHEKSLEIWQQTRPENRPNLINCYDNIGNVFSQMNEYSKAVSYYEKALEIRKKSLPENNPDLATSYNNIGSKYMDMGQYPKAIPHLENALKIYEETFPKIHPYLAASYSKVGSLYDKMSEYQNAISYYKKAAEILEKNVPETYPDLAACYNNMGDAHSNVREYSIARSYYQRAFDIWEKSLDPNHPCLKLVKENIEIMKGKM